MDQTTILMTTYKVKLEVRKPFALWQEKMNREVANFPGFVSLEMRPLQRDGFVEWTSVQRFATHEDLLVWRQSSERRKLLSELTSFLVEPLQDIESLTDQNQGGVTEVFVTEVTPENFEAYRAWASKIQQVEAQFSGYQGIYIQAPEKEKTGNWITMLRFDSVAHLDAWLASDERRDLLNESQTIVKKLESHRMISPFAGWFANVAKTSGEVPAVWKQTMLILLVLFPIVVLEIKFLNPHLKSLNSAVGTFIGNAISVTLVSWPLMPLAIRFLKWWLVPGSVQRLRKNIMGTLVVCGLYLIEIALLWRLIG